MYDAFVGLWSTHPETRMFREAVVEVYLDDTVVLKEAAGTALGAMS